MKTNPVSYLNLLIVLTIPLIPSFYFISNYTITDLKILHFFLTIIFLIVIFSHSGEFLTIKYLFLLLYAIISFIGFIFLFTISQVDKFLYFIILSALGTSTLLIPGEIRFLTLVLSKLRRTVKPGKLEAFTLLFVRVPWKLQEIRDGLKYSLLNNPWKTRIKNIFNTEFVISVLFNMIKMIHLLAEVTKNRKYLVNNNYANFFIKTYERMFYIIGIILFIWLGFFKDF